MNYYIISGEASGDLHGSALIREIKNLDPHASFRCWGGDLMSAEGAHVIKHYKDLAFMGFTEVLLNIRTILNNIKFCQKDVVSAKPDVLILIDYPGFNLRIAEYAKKKGIKVFYYITPQVWAWKESRVKKLKKFVDKLFVILPFEQAFFKRFGVDVDFVGHPLLDQIEGKFVNNEFKKKCKLDERPVIALLPGSRKQEISIMLPLMLTVVPHFPSYQFVVAGAPSIPEGFYNEFVTSSNVTVIHGNTYEILKRASAALVTSGTATLETALFEVPEVVCYRGGNISYQIAKRLIKVKYISLVNLIMDREVVKELIQKDLTTENLKQELYRLLQPEAAKKTKEDYKTLKEKLGGKGASERTAKLMIRYLKSA